MKTGKTLTQLAQELERVKATAKDFLVPTSKLEMNEQGKMSFTNGAKHEFGLNSWSSGQVASYTEIPKAYFDRLQVENKSLLATNVNHALRREAGRAASEDKSETRMLRTLDGHVRGFVSSKYRRLDSYDLLNETLPILLENGFSVESSELTERRLYVKAVTPKLQTEIKKGDAVQFGLVISNSDVGSGSLRIEPLIYRLVCLNGLITSTAIRKYHVGRDQGADEISEMLTDKTRMLNDAAFYSTVRDLLMNSLKPEVFEREVNKIREASERKITNFDLEKVVELTMAATKVTGESVKKNILAALASGNEGAGLTQWGLANSFTRAAQDAELSYDDATDMERAGGQIIELSQGQWKRIAEAV